ncbi:hypothetical protein BD410DRAFT_789868 [Rickenella mellea]|uniref:DUF6699 domain-containing protein n=1 Tax=Rickenella mellea TaxID=50990 RepID=A0A4Y7Q2B1_9AGAM|nr:hypothetical protein BD410DRAFT_789868 [Rickenella mellea]
MYLAAVPTPISPPASPTYQQRIDPGINDVLSPWTSPVVFDVRKLPQDGIAFSDARSAETAALGRPVLLSRASAIRIISREFPWVIDIRRPANVPVTCLDLLTEIHDMLAVEVEHSEWGGADAMKQRVIQRAHVGRTGSGTVGKILRVDWLGPKVLFLGLATDDGLVKARLLPKRRREFQETLVAVFGAPSR